MKGWVLLLVGLGVIEWSVTTRYGDKINVGFYLRLITFIICCIWG